LSAGTYDDPFDNPDRGAIAYQSGSWTSTWTAVAFAFDELVASWNAPTPTVWMVGAMTSAAAKYDIPSAFGGAASDNAVRQYSQETHRGEFPEYDGGGEAWCSPTSTAMILKYWGTGPSATDLAAFPGP